MTDDARLRADVLQALEAVTPLAPWLTSTVRDSLREHRKKGGRRMLAATRFSVRGLTAVTAVLLVALVAAAALGLLALRSVAPLVPAHRSTTSIAHYADSVGTDYGHVVDTVPRACVALDDTGCPGAIATAVSACQAFVSDLDRTPPPPGLEAVHGRMRVELQAAISDLQLVLAAFQARDLAHMNRVTEAFVAELTAVDLAKSYVLALNSGPSTLSDSEARYASRVASGYDHLQLATFNTTVVGCKLADGGCAALWTVGIAAEQDKVRSYQSDLQANPPPSRFASTSQFLQGDLAAEIRDLDDVRAAFAARDDNAMDIAKQNLTYFAGAITHDAGDVMYAR
ncbi:MAG TPA: hypothetical protein VF160_00390 [Candidatus Dormibacteraeota bacterium]